MRSFGRLTSRCSFLPLSQYVRQLVLCCQMVAGRFSSIHPHPMRGKVDHRPFTPKQKVSWRQELERARSILPFLLTVSEELMMARRIDVAKRLLRGESRCSITASLRVGKRTVEWIDRWLRVECDQYQAIFPLAWQAIKDRSDRKIPPVISRTCHQLRKQYPRDFLLFSLLLRDMKPRSTE
jgi:uncharacterized protein YerC